MRLLRDFECPSCKEIFERYVDSESSVVTCDCGHMAHKMMSAPTISLEGITGAFPGAHEKWARIREQKARDVAKKNEN